MVIKKSNLIKGATLAIALAGVMTFASSPSYAALGDEDLSHGMYHEDVKVLQEELKDLGLYKQSVNTYFGKTTEYAVRVFQLNQGLSNTGLFDKNTYNKLQEIKNADDILNFDSTLKLNSKGHDVKLLQDSLKALGYLQINSTTENFASMTEKALIAFQKDLGLKADGIANTETIAALNKVLHLHGIEIDTTPPAPTVSKGDQIAATAKKFLGNRYVAGGTSPSGFDCSGFTTYVFRQHGISLPRTSGAQRGVGQSVSRANIQPGDILAYSGHVGIYIGNGQMIHASNPTRGVVIDNVFSGYYSGRLLSIRRAY